MSVGRTVQCWDDAVAESFVASLKAECIDQQSWPTKNTTRRAVVNYIAWYNGTPREPAALHARLPHPNENEATINQDQDDLAEVA